MDLLTTHLTITEFASLKKVERKYVYAAITDGRIVADKVGKHKTITMINAAKYNDLKFKGK